MPLHKLIVSLDVQDALAGLTMSDRLGTDVSFYRIGLGMLTGGGLALANELKQEHGKRIFLDLNLSGRDDEVERAARGLAQFDIDMLSVCADPRIVRAAMSGLDGTKTRLIATTLLPGIDRGDLDANLVREGLPGEVAAERARRAMAAGASGVTVPGPHVATIRAAVELGLVIAMPDPLNRDAGAARAMAEGANHVVVGAEVAQGGLPGLRRALEA